MGSHGIRVHSHGIKKSAYISHCSGVSTHANNQLYCKPKERIRQMRKFNLVFYFSGGGQFACEIEAEDMATAGSIAESLELRLSGCKGYDLYVKKEDK